MLVVTGCSHPRIDKFVAVAKDIEPNQPIYLVTGGFHMQSFSEEEYRKTVNELRRMLVQNIGPTHCTGLKMIDRLKEQWGENFWEMHLGSRMEIK